MTPLAIAPSEPVAARPSPAASEPLDDARAAALVAEALQQAGPAESARASWIERQQQSSPLSTRYVTR